MKTFTILSSLSLLAVPTQASPIIVQQDVTATSSDLLNMEFYAQWAAAAYCNTGNSVGDSITCANSTCSTVEADNAVTLATFAGSATDIEGFIAADPVAEQIVISFRGSHSIRNWITDILFIQSSSDLCDDCYIHSGFLTAWNEVSSSVTAAVASAVSSYPSYSIIATGHSLGAAVATVAGAFLRTDGYSVDIWTYGSPRVGNPAFATFVTDQTGAEYRVTHLDDPVPRLPPLIFGYRHTSPEYWLRDGTATTTSYALADIEVCSGTANVSCNAGESGFDTSAHLYYLEYVSGCSVGGLTWKRADGDMSTSTSSADITDAELETRLNTFAQLDWEYAAALVESGAS